MTEELLAIVFEYIYVPFVGTAAVMAGFFWRLREKDKDEIMQELDVIEDRLDSAITHDQAREMIAGKFEQLVESQEHQTVILQTISDSLVENKLISARLDERVKSIESSIERRSKPR